MSLTTDTPATPPTPTYAPGTRSEQVEDPGVELPTATPPTETEGPTTSEPSPEQEATEEESTADDDSSAATTPRHMNSADNPPADWPEWYRASRPKDNPAAEMLWRAYGNMGLYKRTSINPPPYWGSLEETIAANRSFAYDNMAKTAGMVITFFSMKGGAFKTTLGTWVPSYKATIDKGLTLVIDADTNGLQGAARRFGTYSKTPQPFGFPLVADMILATGKSPTPAEIMSFAQMHYQSGAYLLTLDKTTYYTADQLEYIANALAPMTSATFFDTSPGSKEVTTLGIIRASTVVGVTGIYRNDASMAGIHEALNPDRFGLKPEFDPEKPLLIIVGGVPVKEFNLRTQYDLADKFGVEPHRVALLPDHPMILRANPVDHHAISRLFMYAIGDVYDRMIKMAIDYRQLHPIVDPTTAPASNPINPRDALIEQLLLHSTSPDEAAMHVLQFAQARQTTSS